MSDLIPNPTSESALTIPSDISFNFLAVLQGRAGSQHTHRAYARWVDRFLVDSAGLEPTNGKKRTLRMQALPLARLIPAINPTTLRAWLGRLYTENQGKQALNQARASIVTLASLLSEAGWLDDYTAVALTNVRIPRAEGGQRKGRWLSVEQIIRLMRSAEAIAGSPAQRARNAVVIRTLCIMALRREELVEILWKDLHSQAGRPVLLVHGKGSKAAMVDVPNSVLEVIDVWTPYILKADTTEKPNPNSYLIRRVYKGGHVVNGTQSKKSGLTTDAVWRIVGAAAEHAGLGKVAPHDLRRSIAGNLEQSGVPVETISRLLRHSNIAVTQQYLSKLPRENEGAIIMSDLLGFK